MDAKDRDSVRTGWYLNTIQGVIVRGSGARRDISGLQHRERIRICIRQFDWGQMSSLLNETVMFEGSCELEAGVIELIKGRGASLEAPRLSFERDDRPD